MGTFMLIVLLAIHAIFAWIPEMEDGNLFEGDMILSPEQVKEVESGNFGYGSMKRKDRLWLNENGEAIVPYLISDKLLPEAWAVHEIKAAINEYHKYTCIKFIPRTNEDKYIKFYKGTSCTSPVGRQGSNYIQLGPACWWRTTIMHEIGHSLGLYHEQSRPDRDDYITVLYGGISRASLKRQFTKETKETVDSLDTPYDYLSIMHYGWSAFGNGAMTIKTKDPKYQYAIGQDENFSKIDVIQINKMYQCKGTYPTPPPYKFAPPGCINLVNHCSRNKYKGHCEQKSYRRYVEKNCRKTCGFCGGDEVVPTNQPLTGVKTNPPKTNSPSCVDNVVNCSSLGKEKCNDASWSNFMSRKCQKYCNLC